MQHFKYLWNNAVGPQVESEGGLRTLRCQLQSAHTTGGYGTLFIHAIQCVFYIVKELQIHNEVSFNSCKNV